MKKTLPVGMTLIAIVLLGLAGCGGAKPEPDPNYQDPAAHPSALPDMPANLPDP